MTNTAQTQAQQDVATVVDFASKANKTASNLNQAVSGDASSLIFPASMPQVAKAISAELGFNCNVNTLRTRWMNERILPAYADLKVPQIKTEDGSVTEFGYEAIKDFIAACIVGKNGMKIASEAFREALVEQFGEIEPVVDPAAEILKRNQEVEQSTSALAIVQSDAARRVEALRQRKAALAAAIEAERLARQQEEEEAALIAELEALEIANAEMIKERKLREKVEAIKTGK